MKFRPNPDLAAFLFLNIKKWAQKAPERATRRAMEKVAEKFRGNVVFVDLRGADQAFLVRFHSAAAILRAKMEEKASTDIKAREFGRRLDELEALLREGGGDVPASHALNY